MIRSKIWVDSENNVDQSQEEAWSNPLYLISLLFIVSIFITILRFGFLIPLDIFIWRPVLIIGVVIVSALWLMLWQKVDFLKAWSKVKENILIACILSLVFGLSNIWQHGSGLIPLSFKEIGLYLLTFGILPVQSGPESMLRGFVFGLAIAYIINEYKKTKQDIKSLFGGLVLWLIGSLVLIIPSITLLMTLIIGGVNGLGLSGTELLNEFSRFNLNTYWSNQQIIRWFTGFGGQLPTAFTLYSASWIFVFTCVVWLAANIKKLISGLFIKNNIIINIIFLFSALISGWSLGYGRMPKSNLDLAAWLVFIFTLLSLHVLFIRIGHDFADAQKKLEPTSVWLGVFVLLGALLLGWPVFLPIVASLVLYGLYSSFYTQNKLSYRFLLIMAWPFMASAALSFIRRADVPTENMMFGLICFWLLVIPVLLVTVILRSGKSWYWGLAFWLLSGLILAIWLKTLVALAILVFFVVFTQILRRWPSKFEVFWPYVILAAFFIEFGLVFWIPRLMQPRIMPL